MNYHSHKLKFQNHPHIIDRQDAVTGDTIKANDEVVFCSACQSVFLKESWEYMNAIHCNQTETLGFVPAQEKEIKARNKNALIFEVSADVKAYRRLLIFIYSIVILICVISIIVISYILIEPDNSFTEKIVLSISALILNSLVVITFRNLAKQVKKNCYIGTVPLQIHQDRVILFDRLHNWEDIKSITHTSTVFNAFSKSNIPNKLRIHLENENIDIKGYHG